MHKVSNSVSTRLSSPFPRFSFIDFTHLNPRTLRDNVEPVRVLLLQLGPLSGGVSSLEIPVLVSGVDFPRDLHLDPFVGSDDDVRGTVELKELGEDELQSEAKASKVRKEEN